MAKRKNEYVESDIDILELDNDVINLLRDKDINTVGLLWTQTRKSLKTLGLKDSDIKQIIIKLQLLITLLRKPKVLFIDNIMSYFSKEEVNELNSILKDYIKEYKTTIVITTIDLNNTIESDYLIIFNDNKIVLEGEPLKVLEKDNIINKVDLDLPFMIDLSSKLRDYDLIKEIELDKEKLINTLWK